MRRCLQATTSTGLIAAPRLATTLRTPRWRAYSATVALVILLGGCGDDDNVDGAEAAADGEQPGFCADLEQLVSAGIEFNQALFGGDARTLQSRMDEYSALVETAVASVPPEMADEMATLRDYIARLSDQLENVDPSDPEALSTAVVNAGAVELEETESNISDYARAECDFDPAARAGGADEAG